MLFHFFSKNENFNLDLETKFQPKTAQNESFKNQRDILL